ncbi:MAG: thioredoxin domain-containing protein [Chloroflexi bacterium]|nr:thioredoxin domain-containing protein [Chloroflexota bacterium]
MITKYRAALVLFLLCLASASTLAQSTDPYADIAKTRSPDGGFVLGDANAAVKLIEFSDFLCGSCQRYEPSIAGFIRDYVLTGQAQFEYRIFPVIDPQLSVQSASLVECADSLQPGYFWHAHDTMFQLTTEHGFTAESTIAFAELLDMDAEALGSCATTASQHAVDAQYGFELGVSGTPSLFVQYGSDDPLAIPLAMPEQLDALVNAIRPQSEEPVLIEHGRYAGIPAFRRADGGFVLGDPAAPLTIVAFEDFLCPHCQVYQDTLHLFVETHIAQGLAQFEYRFFPVVNPDLSVASAALAECVAVQDLGKFWDAHDLLFEFASAGSLDNMSDSLANLLQLDAAALEACSSRAAQYLFDTHLAQSTGVTGTPATRARVDGGELEIVYAGGQPVDRGGLPYEMLSALADGVGEISVGAPEATLLNESYLMDDSLLTGEPCAAPCWHGIRPGETSLADALDIVGRLDGMTVVNSSDTTFVFASASGAPCCQISSQGGEHIATMLFQLAPHFTVGDLIAAHGEPSFVTGQPFSASESVLMLYYPETPMLLYAVVAGMDGQLNESSPIVSAIYAAEDVFAGAFATTPFDNWKGYLTYNEYMDGQFDHMP